MRIVIFLLLFSISICKAQQVSIKRDSTLSTKEYVSLYVKNNMLSPMFCKIIPKDNIPETIIFTEITVIKPSERINNFIKVPRNILKTDSSLITLRDYFNFKFGYGDPSTVKHTDEYEYLLPYKRNRKLIQGNYGNFSHDHISSYHAFDFGTQIGDTIYAAREGKVVMIKESSKKHGRTRKFINHGNYVIIQHDDGTTAAYFHLNFNGALVEQGDLVERGQAIGISGMTGFTTTPHLHFVVHKATEKNGNVSVAIQFEGFVGKKFRKGRRYTRRRK
ncbi:M23 family metallopeptidase [Kordia sp.]|uniref:M23 family metallopeptidase n=1 Tax=Kordia sp. TaxID=1965332 RepID=UPI003D27B13F